MQKRHVPIFTSVTNEALPYLAVTLKSISDFTGEGCVSDVRVLTSGLAAYNQRKLRHLSLPRVSISIVDINRRVEDYRADFEERLGYFLSEESFYPFFIASAYPKISRALYVECGSLIRRDVEEIYRVDMENSLICGYKCSSRGRDALFLRYVREWVGINPEKYIDTSAMLMNFTLFRKYRIENRFIRLIMGYNFDSVSVADDYMNFLCRGKVRIADEWGEGDIVTYRPYERPWRHVNLAYADEFWDVARKTPFYEEVRNAYFQFDDTEKEKETSELEKLVSHAEKLSVSPEGFYNVLGENYLI